MVIINKVFEEYSYEIVEIPNFNYSIIVSVFGVKISYTLTSEIIQEIQAAQYTNFGVEKFLDEKTKSIVDNFLTTDRGQELLKNYIREKKLKRILE